LTPVLVVTGASSGVLLWRSRQQAAGGVVTGDPIVQSPVALLTCRCHCRPCCSRRRAAFPLVLLRREAFDRGGVYVFSICLPAAWREFRIFYFLADSTLPRHIHMSAANTSYKRASLPAGTGTDFS